MIFRYGRGLSHRYIFFFFEESDANMESIRESCLDTIKELNQELFDLKEQCKEFDRMNKQLIIENEIFTNQLSDRSIAVRHHSTSPTEEVRIALFRLTYL